MTEAGVSVAHRRKSRARCERARGASDREISTFVRTVRGGPIDQSVAVPPCRSINEHRLGRPTGDRVPSLAQNYRAPSSARSALATDYVARMSAKRFEIEYSSGREEGSLRSPELRLLPLRQVLRVVGCTMGTSESCS